MYPSRDLVQLWEIEHAVRGNLLRRRLYPNFKNLGYDAGLGVNMHRDE